MPSRRYPFRLYFLLLLLTLSSSFAQTSTAYWSWAKSAGGSGTEAGTCVATDAAGNVYVAGTFNSNDFIIGANSLNHIGSNDLFLIKYDSTGAIIWAKGVGSSGMDYSTSICTDTNGNVYWVGYFSGSSITFGTNTFTNSINGRNVIFVVKYDSNGTVLWGRSYNSSNMMEAHGVASDSNNDIYVTGFFTGSTVTLGSTTLTSNGFANLYLLKLNSTGTILWAKSGNANSGSAGRAVATDNIGNIYVTGEFSGSTLTLGATSLSNTGTGNMYLVKYNVNGNVIWAKSANSTSLSIGRSVATDKTGNIYLIGDYSGPSINLGSGAVGNTGMSDVFIARYDSSGIHNWVYTLVGSGDDFGKDIVCDTSGNVLLTFESAGILIGGDLFGGGGESDLFVFKFFPTGGWEWAVCIYGAESETGLSCAADRFGYVYFTGYFESEFFGFDPHYLENPGATNSDMFITKLYSTPAVGLIKYELKGAPIIFPNPSNGEFRFRNLENETWFLSIYNTIGECVYKSTSINPSSTINILERPSGVYFYRLKNSKGVSKVGKIVIQ